MLHENNQFVQYQPFLQSVAYKIVGSIQDAEDIVQEVFLKFLSLDTRKIENVKAYLTRSVINFCYNHLEKLGEKKRECLDMLGNIEFSEWYKDLEFPKVDLEQQLSDALKTLSKKLEPMEKAVFLLKEVFDFDYKEVQEVLNKKVDNCRQLLSRAKFKLNTDAVKFKINNESQHKLIHNFKNTCNLEGASDLIHDLVNEMTKKIKDKKK